MKSGRSVVTRAVLTFVLMAMPLPAAPAPSSGTKGPHPPTQLFTIRFKDVNDVYLLIEPLLSEAGSVQMQPRLRTLAVTDDEETLKKIEAMIQSYDLPPKNVDVALQLILASTADKTPETISPRIRGVIQKLNEISTRWSDYRLLGSATLTSSEGDRASVEMGEDYRISFAVDYVSDEQKMVRFKRFTLDRRDRPQAPESREETYTRVLDTALNLKEDKLYIFGASKMESSNRALFMTITASAKR
jgi:type II secretory pathway component GspD/PulD (secretin)